MKVYVITKGEYSDYHICSVATDKETAEKLKTLYTDRWDDAYIEEYDTDDGATELENFAPAFIIRYKVEQNTCFADRDSCKRDFLGVISEDTGHLGACYEEFIEYRDGMTPEKAIKIFLDDFAKYRAEKEGLI